MRVIAKENGLEFELADFDSVVITVDQNYPSRILIKDLERVVEVLRAAWSWGQ